MTNRLIRFLAAAALLAATSAVSQPLPSVRGEPALAPKAQPAPKLRLQAMDAVSSRSLRTQVQLSPVADSELQVIREANQRGSGEKKRLMIGVNRNVDGAAPLPTAGDLKWTAVEGGRAAQAAVTSPQAAALRLAIDLSGVPANVEMVFFGSGATDRLLGPIRVGDIADRTVPWWSPLTEGDTQTVEFFVPSPADARSLPLAIVQVSHLFASPADQFQKEIADIGRSGSCEVDVACSPLNSSTAFRNAVDSVAQMVFTDGSFTGLCTGTLLNDSDPSGQVPWFYSANHCFENESAPYKTPAQMQAVANTLNTLWHFDAASCRSLAQRSDYSQLAGGATYIYNSAQADVLFLRLNGTPPAGSFYSGWDANTIGAGASTVVIHHPFGDLKKVSEGTVLDLTAAGGGVAGGNIPFIRVGWGTAVTEPGSSGAGVFTFDGTEYKLRGGLWGGPSGCSVPTSSRYDWFSRFDLVYPTLAAYLSSGASQIDYTDLWWNPTESGWGLNLIQHASRNIFGVWYTYGLDGKRTWYVIPGGTWLNNTTFRGDIYATTGMPPTQGFDPNRVTRTVVGTGTLTFSDANTGTFAFSINGVTGTKAISRQPF